MKLKTLAFASMFAVASTGVMANDVVTNPAVIGGTAYFGALHTDNLDFTDIFTFTVAGSVKANSSMITIGSGLQNIDFLSADLNGTPLTLSPNGFAEFGTLGDTLLTGPLVLTVKGKSAAAGGTFASYSGTMNVTAVPEPETYAMMLAGLGIVGFLARRRRSV
jgi:PEP-CTERM motif